MSCAILCESLARFSLQCHGHGLLSASVLCHVEYSSVKLLAADSRAATSSMATRNIGNFEPAIALKLDLPSASPTAIWSRSSSTRVSAAPACMRRHCHWQGSAAHRHGHGGHAAAAPSIVRLVTSGTAVTYQHRRGRWPRARHQLLVGPRRGRARSLTRSCATGRGELEDRARAAGMRPRRSIASDSRERVRP